MATLPPPLPERSLAVSTSSRDADGAILSPPISTPPRLPPRKSYVPTSPLQRPSVISEQPSFENVVSDQSEIATQNVKQHEAIPYNDNDRRLAELDQERTRQHVVEPEGKNGNAQTKDLDAATGESFSSTSPQPPPQPPTATTSSTPTADPMALLNSISTSQHIGSFPIPSLGNIALIGFLIIMAYAGASFITLLLASGGVYYLWADWQRREAARRRDPEEDREKVKGRVPPALAMAEESTEWL